MRLAMSFTATMGRVAEKKTKCAQRDKVRTDVGVESCAEAGSKLLVK